MRTWTWPGSNRGAGRSPNVRTSDPPCFSMYTAFKGLSPANGNSNGSGSLDACGGVPRDYSLPVSWTVVGTLRRRVLQWISETGIWPGNPPPASAVYGEGGAGIGGDYSKTISRICTLPSLLAFKSWTEISILVSFGEASSSGKSTVGSSGSPKKVREYSIGSAVSPADTPVTIVLSMGPVVIRT